MINSRMDQIYSKVLEHIDIGDDMFNRAKKEYENFGNWLNKNATGNRSRKPKRKKNSRRSGGN